MSEPLLAWQQRQRQEAIEYGTFRATSPISVGGTVAYQKGHAVPISNVKKFGYDRDGLVERVDGQPVDAPLPDGYVADEPPSDGPVAGWNDSPDGPDGSGAPPAPAGQPTQPTGPQEGQTIEVEGQPAADQPPA